MGHTTRLVAFHTNLGDNEISILIKRAHELAGKIGDDWNNDQIFFPRDVLQLLVYVEQLQPGKYKPPLPANYRTAFVVAGRNNG